MDSCIKNQKLLETVAKGSLQGHHIRTSMLPKKKKKIHAKIVSESCVSQLNLDFLFY